MMAGRAEALKIRALSTRSGNVIDFGRGRRLAALTPASVEREHFSSDFERESTGLEAVVVGSANANPTVEVSATPQD